MARMSWGGAADNSQYFLQLYDAYSQRVESLALEAVRNAQSEQAALDEDAFNRWEAGEMSDAEWIAYAKQRLAESTDEEERTYWKDVLRDSEERVAENRITEGVRDIQNKIDEGTATYADLRKFLIAERSRLKEGSPLYDQLSESIDQVGDTIRDNKANAEIARAGYLFQSGQISGSQASAMIRAAAERYKNSDPARYWNLLSQAHDLATYGSSAGGGGGSGGGSGGGGPSLSSTIDALEYRADAVDLLNQQFQNGEAVGTLPDGSPVPLRDENGNPTEVWGEIDQMMVDTLRSQYELKIENGDRDAVEALQRLETYIKNDVQPRNTIPQEQQFGIFQNNLAKAVELAAIDPRAGAKAINSTLAAAEQWAKHLNQYSVQEFLKEEELSGGLNRTTAQALAGAEGDAYDTVGDLASGTDAFQSEAQAWVAAARAAVSGGEVQSDDPLIQSLGQVGVVSQGLQDGSWVPVMTSNGMTAVPMVPTSMEGPDGQPVMRMMPDIDIAPDAQRLTQVLTTVNGQPQMVWTVGDYLDVDGQRSLVISDGQSAFMQNENGEWADANGDSIPVPTFGMTARQAASWLVANPVPADNLLQTNGSSVSRMEAARIFSEQMAPTRTGRVRHGSGSGYLEPQGPRPPLLGGSRQPVDPSRGRSSDYLGLGSPKLTGVASDLGINFKVKPVNVSMPQIKPPNVKLNLSPWLSSDKAGIASKAGSQLGQGGGARVI